MWNISEVMRNVKWCGVKCKWSDVKCKRSYVKWKWSDVQCSDVEWTDVIYVKWFCLKWVTLKFLGTKLPCILGWPYTEGTWLYCNYFIWCVSCTVAVLTCFVVCGCVCMCEFCNVWVFWQLCGCFANMCTCVYCVLYCLYCVFVLFRLGIFILIRY